MNSRLFSAFRMEKISPFCRGIAQTGTVYSLTAVSNEAFLPLRCYSTGSRTTEVIRSPELPEGCLV